MAAPYTFKVRFMDDRDPFTVAYAEPTVPPTFVFAEEVTLLDQMPHLIKVLNAPHQVTQHNSIWYLLYSIFLWFAALTEFVQQVEEATLQVSIDNSYLDLDSTITDICDNGNLDPTNRKTILILRTSLSVRVHNCCGKNKRHLVVFIYHSRNAFYQFNLFAAAIFCCFINISIFLAYLGTFKFSK